VRFHDYACVSFRALQSNEHVGDVGRRERKESKMKSTIMTIMRNEFEIENDSKVNIETWHEEHVETCVVCFSTSVHSKKF
jgi:hypothetical protein